MALHVFFDNSNIWGGAQNLRAVNEPGVPWWLFRIYYQNLFEVLEGARRVETAVLAGSVPPSCDALWEYANRQGYDTDLLKRVQTDDGRNVEQGVDEVLHLKIANALLDYDGEQTLLIATGDGSISQFGTGFPKQAERALKKGWKVEIWCWENTAKSIYRTMAKQNPACVSLNFLDPHYDYVSFVKPGTWNVAIDGETVSTIIHERIVSPVPAQLKNRK